MGYVSITSDDPQKKNKGVKNFSIITDHHELYYYEDAKKVEDDQIKSGRTRYPESESDKQEKPGRVYYVYMYDR